MSNILGIDKQVQIISALAEGSGIRGIHRDTITRLGVYVERDCASLMNSKMRDYRGVQNP